MDWLVQLDERLFLAVNSAGGPAWDIFFGIVTQVGRGSVLALLVIGPMAIFDRQRLRYHLLAMILSVSAGAIFVEGSKWAVDRDRPARHFAAARKERSDAPLVRMVGRSLYRRSFPSGHAQAAFGAATYVGLVYRPLLGPAIGLASLIGLSRVYLGVHFPLDVLAGALAGVLFSVAGHRLRTRSRSRSGDAR